MFNPEILSIRADLDTLRASFQVLGGGLTSNTDYGTLTPDFASNTPSYWNSGSDLPAGKYRVSWVSGALNYSTNVGPQWSVNPGAVVGNGYYVTYNTATPPVVPNSPGATDIYGTEDEALAASEGTFIEIDHGGGRIGMYLHDSPYNDNAINLGAPTFRLETVGLNVRANSDKNITIDEDGVGVVDSPTFSGTVTASALVGDGSGITGLAPGFTQVLKGGASGTLALAPANTLTLAGAVLTGTTSNGTLTIQSADSSHTGLLTSTDWSTFNGKQATITSTTALSAGSLSLAGVGNNQIVFGGTSGILIGSSSLTLSHSVSGDVLAVGGSVTITGSLSVNPGGTSNTVIGASSVLVNATAASDVTIIGANSRVNTTVDRSGLVLVGSNCTKSGFNLAGSVMVGDHINDSAGTTVVIGSGITNSAFAAVVIGSSVSNTVGIGVIGSQTWVTHARSFNIGTGPNFDSQNVNELSFGTGSYLASNGAAFRLVGCTDQYTMRGLLRIVGSWVTGTDASRKARATFYVLDTADREFLRVDANGTSTPVGTLTGAWTISSNLTALGTANALGSVATINGTTTLSGSLTLGTLTWAKYIDGLLVAVG